MIRPILACLAVVWAWSATAQQKEIIGYFPSWKWRPRDNLVTPATIPYQKFTILNYAFFYPLTDGSIVGRNPEGDSLYLRGERDPQTGAFKPGTRLTDIAHRHGVKVLPSIGGWEDSNNFPEVAADQAKRAMFAHSCIEQIKEYGFDGIDIDWEFPGYIDHKGTPADRQNFTHLLQTLRDSLDNYERSAGRHYLLTAALPAGRTHAANIDVELAAKTLDFLNIMTYDFNGPWDPLSGHNAPLYAGPQDDSTRSVDAAFRLYANTYRIPPQKINLGVPFYGHTFSRCTALGTPHGGSDTVHIAKEGAFYYAIARILDSCVRQWDDRAKAPTLVNASWNLLISYDDEESVGFKARYVLEKNARGLIIWEITGDFLEDGRTPLLDVIYRTFHPSINK